MRWWRIIATACLLSLMLAVPAVAAPSYYGGNCALYARQVTGVELAGDAGAWWGHAEGHYQRGQAPTVGAVLVFRPTGHMRHGHVAVVSRVVSNREILVDQANWIRGRIVKNMSVIDASASNDWTSVKVVELSSRTHGRENPTYGFIYPTPPQRNPRDNDDRVVTASDGGRQDKATLPVRLAATGLGTPWRTELRLEPARVQAVAYHPTEDAQVKRDERELRPGKADEAKVKHDKDKTEKRHGEKDAPKAKQEGRERHDTETDASKPQSKRPSREARHTDGDAKNMKKPKPETTREAHHDKDPKQRKTKQEAGRADAEVAKAKHEPRHSDSAAVKAKPEKNTSERTDAAKSDTKHQRTDSRHASAASPPKSEKTGQIPPTDAKPGQP